MKGYLCYLCQYDGICQSLEDCLCQYAGDVADYREHERQEIEAMIQKEEYK